MATTAADRGTTRVHSPENAGGGAAEGSLVPRTAAVTALAAALLIGAAGLVGLMAPEVVYRDVPEALADAVGAQDLVGVVVVAPLLIVLVLRASRGSSAAWACCLGVLSFTAYNAAIYAFSIPFGPLFMVWVALLGLSTCGLVTGLVGLRPPGVASSLVGPRARVTGWFLVAVAGLFASLWLAQIGSDLATGGPSISAATWAVPTNPVHVLDLALFLPAVLTTGVMVLRRHWFGAATAAGQLVFLGLTCLPILATPVVASSREHAAGWGVVAPIGLVMVLTAGVLYNLLKNATPRVAARSRT